MKFVAQIFCLTALLLLSACGNKEKHLPFSSRLAGGDVCAIIHVSEFQEKVLNSSVLNGLPKLRPFAMQIDLAQILNLKNDSLFIASDFKRAVAYAEIKSGRTLQDELDTWFKNSVEKADSMQGFTVYHWPSQHVSIAFTENTLILTHKYDIAEKINAFVNATTIDPTWQRVLEQKQAHQDFYAYMRDTLNPNVITCVYDTLIADDFSFHFEAKSTQDLPFELSGLSQGFTKGDMGINFHYTSITGNRLDHYIFKAFDKFGVNAQDVLHNTTGDYSFFNGGKIIHTKEIVSTEMDDNFNTVEVKKIIKEEVDGFTLRISGNPEGLEKQLKEAGMLQENNEKYQILYINELNKVNDENHFILSSSSNEPALQENPFFIYYRTEVLDVIIPTIHSSKNKVSFDLRFDGKNVELPGPISMF